MHFSLLTTDIKHHIGWEENVERREPIAPLAHISLKTRSVHVEVPSLSHVEKVGLRTAPLVPRLH